MKTNRFKLTKELEVAATRWRYQRRALPEAKQFADEAVELAAAIEGGKGGQPVPRIAAALDRWRLAILAAHVDEIGTARGKRVAALLAEIRELERVTIGTPDRAAEFAPTVPDSEVI
ncbi:hypothetical protein [Tsukamurella paurometabola]|uniref:Uncharacterized protein n=1 Tax=Tsukamurella paurometabola TaxID=2061 RepID=A0A3P8K4Z2_TSUPA|nr:hypothetical protein [Tsukamurella paurometabola]UEA83304.1 hypothetical protein LK411_00125 [Tsukamurella paurometabola]VDR40409.1 Uncharacterised protein [Tsukamurella paurometabola]